MKAFLRKIFGIKAPLLEWQSQYVTREGVGIMTYAKSRVGTYEIYWSDDNSEFLLSYPVKKPADLFNSLFEANDAAQSHYNTAYFSPHVGSR